MAAPSEASVRTALGLSIKLLNETLAFGGSNTPNVIGMFDAIRAGLAGDRAAAALDAAQRVRSNLSALLARSEARRLIDPLWIEYGKVMDFAETDPVSIIQRLREDFATRGTPQSVKSRGLTLGTPAASGTPAGNGSIHRLTVDEHGETIEIVTPDAKIAECVGDEHSGASAEHEEVFEIRGGNPAPDLLAIEGSGIVLSSVAALSSRASQPFVRNPSFANDNGQTGSNLVVTGWEPATGDTISEFETDTTAANIYRTDPGEGTSPKALRIKSSATLEQNLNTQPARFEPGTPYYCQVAINKTPGTAVGGTFRLTLGAVSATIDVTTMAAGWNIVKIAVGQNNWFRNFNQEDLKVKVGWESATSGYLLVDDLILAPYTFFDGSWYAIVGGSTPFLRHDKFAWTDSVSTDSIIQKWLWLAYGQYLPSVSSSETWSDPT